MKKSSCVGSAKLQFSSENSLCKPPCPTISNPMITDTTLKRLVDCVFGRLQGRNPSGSKRRYGTAKARTVNSTSIPKAKLWEFPAPGVQVLVVGSIPVTQKPWYEYLPLGFVAVVEM